MAGPLDGVRVLDLTTVLMGPFATQTLADLGADVIKIEAPGGDSNRHLGPLRNPGMSAGFLHTNRNKRSVVLDLKSAAGRAALLEVAATVDIVVTNVRPAAMARLRLDYEAFAAASPAIIHVSLVGYGQNGPYADKAAYDDMIQAACAIPSLQATAGDGTPRYIPLAIVDRAVGQAAATATLAALVHRLRTGEGQALEVPMFETMAPYVLAEHLSGRTFEPPIGGMGYPRLLARTRQAYPTSDGHVCMLLYTERHWDAFFTLVGEPDRFRTDPRLATFASRTQHVADLYADVGRALKAHTTAWWLEALRAADIPVNVMHTLESLMHDPHLEAVGFFRTFEHPTEGPLVDLAPLGRWSRTQPVTRRGAPRLGEHTDEVLAEARARVNRPAR